MVPPGPVIACKKILVHISAGSLLKSPGAGSWLSISYLLLYLGRIIRAYRNQCSVAVDRSSEALRRPNREVVYEPFGHQEEEDKEVEQGICKPSERRDHARHS